jgi:alpha-tubulin suppressor-like RCC1 family protein
VVDTGSTVTAVSAGDSFTCAVLADETAKCWGENDGGQLGDGTFTGQTRPVSVVGLSHVKKMVSDRDHSCALLDDGSVMCWGDNESGQLGDGTHETHSAARPVLAGTAPLANVVDLAVGANHSCAVVQGGTMKCWGNNDFGQVGSSTPGDKPSPIDVALATTPTAGPTGVTQIVAGDSFTCALDGKGLPWCWGANDVGELGVGDAPKSSVTPIPVSMPQGVTIDQLAAYGGFACAHASTNDVWCWGFNGDGELATGNFNFAFNTPQKIAGLMATTVVVGEQAACALTTDRNLSCWGGDYLGQVGIDEYNGYDTPVTVAGLANVSVVVAGGEHTCAIVDGGKLMCWGDDRDGELGNGIALSREPVAPQLACPK